MSLFYELFVFLPDGIPGGVAVHRTHDVIESLGGELDEFSHLMLNETETDEPDAEPIVDAAEALQRLATWPTYGSISYSMPEGPATVSYDRTGDDPLVRSIKVGIYESMLDQRGEESQRRYRRLARELHDRFGATRTVMDLAPTYRGFDWRQELERLDAGTYVGSYSVVDLRRESDDSRSLSSGDRPAETLAHPK